MAGTQIGLLTVVAQTARVALGPFVDRSVGLGVETEPDWTFVGRQCADAAAPSLSPHRGVVEIAARISGT